MTIQCLSLQLQGAQGQRSNARVNKVLTDFAGSVIRASVASFLEGHFETC